MIDIQRPLSPLLAALLLKEFTPEQIEMWAAAGDFDAVHDKTVVDRFLHGLEEHRLDLYGGANRDEFCSVVLTYLEALLDPGSDVLQRSGIEITASSATTVWREMSDEQRTSLWQETSDLHATIAPLVGSESVVRTLREWRSDNQPKG